MVKIICCKCYHVLDIDKEPDTGECPKCSGAMYQEGDIFDENLTPSQKNAIELMAEIRKRLPKPKPILN